MLNKLDNYIDSILLEATDEQLDSMVAKIKELEKPGHNLSKAFRDFKWKNSRPLKEIKDEALREDIAKKAFDVLVKDFKDNVGKVFTWYAPSNRKYVGKVLSVDETNGVIEFEGTSNLDRNKIEKYQWNIGILNTDNTIKTFEELMKEPLEANRLEKEKAKEEAEKAAQAKKDAYSTPEMEKVIKAFNDDFMEFCRKDFGKVSKDLKKKVDELPLDQKEALLNYWSDYRFENPSLIYYDGSDYNDEKMRLDHLNSRASQLVRELK